MRATSNGNFLPADPASDVAAQGMTNRLVRGRRLKWCFLPMLLLSASAQVTAPRLEVLRPETSNGWMRLNSTFHSNTVITLRASTNLSAWNRASRPRCSRPKCLTPCARACNVFA
jgi:hypothetical protein